MHYNINALIFFLGNIVLGIFVPMFILGLMLFIINIIRKQYNNKWKVK